METHQPHTNIRLSPQCSYRTYEEWKQVNIIQLVKIFDRSYRTYEEWKHHSSMEISNTQRVLTVPMRNGNLILLHT